MPTASGNAVWALKATSVQFTCGCFPGTRVWNGDHREREREAGSEDRATLKFLFPELTSCLSLSLLPLSLSLEFQFQGTKVRRLCLCGSSSHVTHLTRHLTRYCPLRPAAVTISGPLEKWSCMIPFLRVCTSHTHRKQIAHLNML